MLLCCAAAGTASAQKPYWQQRVDNRIAVTLDDEAHMLRGLIYIGYHNNSPDTLKHIYFHLYPNAYSSDRTAFEKQAVENGNTDHYFSDEEDRGYIDSLDFRVSSGALSRAAGIVATKDPDIIRLVLPQPLAPNDSVEISTPFRVKIPLTFSRLGHEGQTYQISQWFPKPAVYDSKGWHPIPYLDQGEFYSEFGKYHVAITLPENYIVMGTGNILEEQESAWLDSLSRLPLPQEAKATSSRRDTATVPSSPVHKTITFEEEHIHDFAWFADKKWRVRKDTVAVPGTGHVVTAYTCYRPLHQKGWAGSIEAVKTGIRKYSEAVGPYPYKTVKAVEGALSAGGGMEYPTVTVIAATNDQEMVRTAIVHEVGHNWFYGILGSNERSYPWMDEGINSFYEGKFAPAAPSIPGMKKGDNFLLYAMLAATRDLVPADTAADVMPEMNYGGDIYGKAAYLTGWLEAYMGPDAFREAMREYYDTWKYRHPQPQDFRAVFQQHSKRPLDWFFDEVMRSTKPADFAIGSVKRENGLTVTVHNRTGLKAPAQVVLYQEGPDSAFAWTEPFTGTTTVNFGAADDYRKIKIGDAIPDYNLRNNEHRSPLSVRPLLGLNLQPRTKVWAAPAIGYNYYDGFMAGLLLHNITIPANRFQFALAPLYGFGSRAAAGTGFMSYTAYFDRGWLHDIQFNLWGKSFSYNKTSQNIPDALHARFIKVAPELVFTLRKPGWRSPVERSLSLKGYWIREEQFAFDMNPADSLYYPSKNGYEDNFYGRIRYEHRNKRTFNPFSYVLEAQGGKQFAKLSLEAQLRIDYFKKHKALYLRGYAGKFFSLAGNDFDAYRYRLATTYTGRNDYLYDETYIGRNEQDGLGSQQVSIREGGFKVNTLQYAAPLGLSDDWLFALNIKTDIPFWNLPVRLFVDVATFSRARQLNPSGAGVLYEAGIEIYAGEFLSVYLPLVMSSDFSDYTKSVYPDKRFWRTVSFSLNLGQVNWHKIPSQLIRM